MTSTPVALPPDSPVSRLLLPGLAFTLGILYAVTRDPATPVLLTATFGVLGIAYLPGLALSLWLDRRFGLWASLILPLILSPVISVGAALLLAVSGFPLGNTGGWIVLVSVLGIALAPQPQREIEDWAVSLDMPGFLRRRSDRQQVIALALLVLVVLGVVFAWGGALGEDGESRFHRLLVASIRAGAVPPEDPDLAGLAVRYPWAFHAYVALLGSVTRLSFPVLSAGGSTIAALVLVFAAYRLLGLLALSHARALWGVAFLFFALSGLAWIVPLAGVVRDGVFPAWGTLLARPDPLLPAGLGPGGLPAQTGIFFLETMLVAGPFALALVYVLLFLSSTVASLGEDPVRRSGFAILAGVGMLLFQTGVGLLVFATLLLCLPFVWLAARLSPWRGEGRDLFTTVPLMAVSLLVAAPYLGPLLRGGSGEFLRLVDVSLPKVGFFLLALAPDLLLGTGVLVAFLRRGNARRTAFALWTLVLLGLSLLVAAPGGRPLLVPLVLAHVPLALLAGASVPTWWERGGRTGRIELALLLFLFLLPGTAWGVTRYFLAQAPSPDPSLERTAAWVSRETPPASVLVAAPPELAAAARRSLLYARPSASPSLGYPEEDLVWRREALRDMRAGRAPREPARSELLALHRPLYLVRRIVPGNAGAPEAGPYREVHRNGAYEVLLWVPSAEGGR